MNSFKFLILAALCAVVYASEGSTDGVEELLENFDVDASGGLNTSEVELYLQHIRGTDEEHCANVSALFEAINVSETLELNTNETIKDLIVAVAPCVLSSYCGVEFEVEIDGEPYHCTAEGEEHDHDRRRLSEEEHDHEGEGEEFELAWSNGAGEAEFHCVLEEEEEPLPSSYTAEVWGRTLGSVFLISLIAVICSLFLLVLMRKGKVEPLYLEDFTAFAVGILLWAAVVHVLPEAVEFYGSYDWKFGVCFIAGVFASACLEMTFAHHDHGQDILTAEESKADSGAPITIVEESKPLNGTAMNIIWGDAVHNFSDGILIALAFGACDDSALGVAVTVAIVAHELPQELTDFMILVRSGQSPCRALMYNLLSALAAFLGAIIVLSIGVIEPEVQGLLLAATAGVLVFIALGELFPSVVDNSAGRKKLRMGLLVCGFLLGGLLLLIPDEHCELGGHDHDHE